MSNYRKLDNIVIVGGGAAGWIAALYARIALPKADITVVESSDIGILGAGEGTVPDFIEMTDFLGIPFSKLVKEADATIKNSIKFTNWTGDGSYFHHSFNTDTNLGLDGSNVLHPNVCETNLGILTNVVHSGAIPDIDVVDMAGQQCKVPFTVAEGIADFDADPLTNYRTNTRFAAHFNAGKLANLLKSYGFERGIRVIDGIVTDIEKNEYDEVSKLTLDTGKEIKVDFLFDCTGFSRLFIGKEYGAEWKSHEEHLTVNAAIPFFLPIAEDAIPPYTEAIAMKYGWMWKIPTTERFGCGYVYDSRFIDAEDAKKEVEEYLGRTITVPRQFTFNAGYYKTPWIKNVIALGLSSGFIEPLEATSIFQTCAMLKQVLSNAAALSNRDSGPADEFNAKFVDISEQVVDFLYFHYMSGRKDTLFWEHYTEKNAPESLQKTIAPFTWRFPQYSDFRDKFFILNSWLMIMRGKKQIDQEIAERTYRINDYEGRTLHTYNQLIAKRERAVESYVQHHKLLEDLRREYK